MAGNVVSTATPAARQPWWAPGIEGIVAVIIGVFIVAQPEGAANLIRHLIALALLALSLGQVVAGFRFRQRSEAPWATLRGGVGGTVAALTFLAPVWWNLSEDATRQLLAIGLLGFGVLGIVASVAAVGARRFDAGAMVADALAIVLGVLLLNATAADVDRVRYLGWAAIAGGVALLVYSYTLWQSRESGVRGQESSGGNDDGSGRVSGL